MSHRQEFNALVDELTQEMDDAVARMPLRVFCFDFDGVLAIPYTNPECLFPEVEAILKEVHNRGDVILVSSFNPRAYHVLKSLLDEGIIRAIRAGSRQRWWEQGIYEDAKHRFEMNKRLHIEDMLRDELGLTSFESVFLHFYDDDSRNLYDVGCLRGLAGGDFMLIPSHAGFGRGALRQADDSYNKILNGMSK